MQRIGERIGQRGVAAVLTSTAAEPRHGAAMSALRAGRGEIEVGERESGRCGVSRGARGEVL